MSYEVTERVSRWQRVYKRGTTLACCVISIGIPVQNAAFILKPLGLISTKPVLHMMQHVADWVAPLPRGQHSHPLLKLLHTPSPPPSPSPPLREL